MNRSVGLPLFVVLGVAAYFGAPAGQVLAESSHFYFCEATNSYFPTVQTCAVPWKELDPRPPAPPPVADAAPKHGVVAFPIGMPPPVAPAPAPAPAAAPAPAEPAIVRGPVVFVYGAETPTIVCAVSQLCDVTLQPGEKINQVIVGDPDHWRVEPAAEGSGSGETEHLIIRPASPDLDTTMIVLTRLRAYHMRLQSHRKDNMLQVAFSYPDASGGGEAKAAEDAADEGLVKVGDLTYVKGREPRTLAPKSRADEPPLPAAAPPEQVAEEPTSRSKVQPMPQ